MCCILGNGRDIEKILNGRHPNEYINSIPDEVFDDVFDNGLYKDRYQEIYTANLDLNYRVIGEFIKFELHEEYLKHVNYEKILEEKAEARRRQEEGTSSEEEGYEEGTSSEEDEGGEEEIILKFE